jgi:hypothetical protein
MFERFCDPEVLRKITPRFLVQFLRPYSAFLADRGIELRDGGRSDPIDYERFVEVITSPDQGVPDDLVHGLYFTHELATEVWADRLREEAAEHGFKIVGQDLSPADVAVQVWLKAPAILERLHAEQLLPRLRTYRYFQARTARWPSAKTPAPKVLRAIQERLTLWFEAHDRGKGCRIRASLGQGEVWFLIWHGQTLHRQGIVKGDKSSSVVYRPEKYDIVVYNAKVGELRLKTCWDKELSEYREAFGLHLFGDPDYFPGESKYTLDPLIKVRTKALACDGELIKKVALSELRFLWGEGSDQAVEIHQAEDVFAALKARGYEWPESPRLTLAKFKVWFGKLKHARTVTLRPPNVTSYTRDSDSLPVEEWLDEQGFILPREFADAADQ